MCVCQGRGGQRKTVVSQRSGNSPLALKTFQVESQCPRQVISPGPPYVCLHIWVQLWEVKGSIKYATAFSGGGISSLEEGTMFWILGWQKKGAPLCF